MKRKLNTRILSIFLSLLMVISILPAGAITAQAVDSRIQKAIDWAVSIANDNSHGYSWVPAWRTGPDYDCSSLVGHALYNGGFTGIGTKLKTMSTATEAGYLTELGFKDVTSSVNFASGAGLQAGDVLWVSGHTEMYIGNNKLVGAHQSTKPCYCKNNNGNSGWCIGCYDCGELKGDQTGKEISVTAYYNHPWTKVYRFNGQNNSLGAPTNVKVATAGKNLKVTWNNVSGANCYDVIVTDPSGSQSWWHSSSNSRDIPITKLGTYKVEVQSLYRPNGSSTGQTVGAHSNEVVCIVNLFGPTNVKAAVSGKQFKISWDSVAGANCYDVIVTDPSGATNWYHSNGTERNIPVGKPGTYKFDVQSLCRLNGSSTGQTVGGHSGEISYNLELTAPQNVRFDNVDGKFNVYWDPVAGATCYDVVITKPNGETAWLHTHENYASTDKFEYGKYSFWIQGIYRSSCPDKTGQIGGAHTSDFTFDYQPAVGHNHNWDDGETIVKATCTEDGYVIFTCKDCNETYTTTTPAKGHFYYSRKVDPTCTAEGYTINGCFQCGEEYRCDVVPAKGHNFSTTSQYCYNGCGTVNPGYTQMHSHIWDTGTITKSASCTATGVKTYTCAICEITKTETIAKTGHTYDSGKVTKEETCISTGVKTYTCTKCGATKTETIPVSEYHGCTTEDVEPTCTNEGYTIYECVDCGIIFYDDYINALGHKYTTKVVKSTYTSGGYTLHTCTRCKKSYKDKKTKKLVLKNTSISKVTAGKKAFTIKWKKVSAATGYQVQYATDSKFSKNKKTVTVKKNSTTSKKISKLKAKKKYYVRIRTYKTVKVNGKSTKIYSNWSKAKTVKTK